VASTVPRQGYLELGRPDLSGVPTVVFDDYTYDRSLVGYVKIETEKLMNLP
jgi:hypothetical protein